MTVSANDVLTLLAELEQGDPIEFGELPLAEDEARRIVALSMAKFSEDLAREGVESELREALALATAARVLLDNLALHYRLLSRSGSTLPDAAQLLDSIAARARKV